MRLPEITINLRPEQLAEFNDLSKQTGVSRSQLIRNALDMYLSMLKRVGTHWRPGQVGWYDTYDETKPHELGRSCVECGRHIGFDHEPQCSRRVEV